MDLTSWLVKNFLIPSGTAFGLDALAGLFGGSKSVPLTPEEKVMQGLGYLANQQNALRTSGPDQDMQEGSMEALSGNEETLKELINEGMALGMTQAQLNPAITSAVGPIPTSGAFGAPPQETSALMDLVRAAGGKVVEGTADLGNLVAQAITLGQGPKLEAVIPNILDIIRGNVGGTLVFGGGQNPVPVVGTGQTGIGAGTNVGLNVPIIGPAISKAVTIYNQGGTLADIVRSIPGALINNVPQVLSGVAAAGLLFDENDKKTLVNLGVDPAIIKTQGSNVGGAGTDTIAGGADTVKAVDITGNTTLKSDPLQTGVAKADLSGTLSGDGANIKAGNLALTTGDLASDPIKTGGVGNLALTTGDLASDIIKTGAGNLSLNTGDTASDIIRTGGNLPPLSPAELDEILIKTGSLPAVEGGYDNPQIVKTGEEVKTSTPPAGGGSSSGGSGLPAGGGGVAEIAGEPGELVDIDYLFDVGGDSIFAPEILEEDEDELLYPYSGGGAVKRFKTGDQVTDDYLASVGGSSYGTDSGMQSRSNVDATQEKNIFQKGLPAILGAGLGAAFGLIDKDKPNPSGYQGGIPEYRYDRSLVPDAFSTTNADGTPRRPGSAGRSYFTQGTYTPIMETVDGVEVQSTLGGAQRRADEAAMAAQATEEEDYIAQIGQDFLDLQPVDTTEGLEFTGTITEDFINKYPNAGTGVVDTGVAGTDAGVAGAGAGVVDTGVGAGVIDTGAGAGVIDTGAAAVDTGAGVVDTDFQEFVTFLTPFFNKNSLTNEDFLALDASGYSVAQLATALGVDGQVLFNAIDRAKQLSGAFTTDAVDYLTNTSAGGADTVVGAGGADTVVGAGGADTVTDLQKFSTFLTPFFNKTEGLTNEDFLALGNSEYSVSQLAAALDVDGQVLSNAIENAKKLSGAFNTDAVDFLTNTSAGGADTGAAAVDTGAGVDNVDTLTQFASQFAEKDLTDADLLKIAASDFSTAEVAGKFPNLSADNLQTAITEAQDRETVANTFASVNVTDGIQTKERNDLVGLVKTGKATIGDLATNFDVEAVDVVADLVNNGDMTLDEAFAQTSGVESATDLAVQLLLQGKTTPALLAAQNEDYTEKEIADAYNFLTNSNKYAQGGALDSYYLGGTTDGMADEVPATIGGNQPAALSDGEFVVPADVVSHLGNGNSDAGAKQLYSMMDRVRKKRTGTTEQGTEINPMQQLPA